MDIRLHEIANQLISAFPQTVNILLKQEGVAQVTPSSLAEHIASRGRPFLDKLKAMSMTEPQQAYFAGGDVWDFIDKFIDAAKEVKDTITETKDRIEDNEPGTDEDGGNDDDDDDDEKGPNLWLIGGGIILLLLIIFIIIRVVKG